MINFVILLGTLALRVVVARQISQIEVNSPEYVNVLSSVDILRLMKLIDGINTILIFFSLFYYSSLISPSLRKISAFFIEVARDILNLTFLLIFMLFIFAVLFHSFYEKNIWQMSDFSNSFISTMNLSMGNQYLNEDDELIEEQGKAYYYLVASVYPVLDRRVHLDVPHHARPDIRHHRPRVPELRQEN